MPANPPELSSDLYDVVIAGGGPAGATLAAFLARDTALRVAVFEKEVFPREHIGESFAHRVVSVLQDSGALPSVLGSSCWIRKDGGFYAWDPAAPRATRFDHPAFDKDGVWRWAMHVNRADFDKLLLDHARACGAHVREGCGVTGAARTGAGWRVTLADGRHVEGRYFVQCSGRQSVNLTQTGRVFLSSYKNVAIWNHFEGCLPAQRLPGDWNIFRAEDRSTIGSFAWENGWYWYIPVPRLRDGQWVHTHSIGLVTDPLALQGEGRRHLEVGPFLECARQVPLLRELIAEARPCSEQMLSATNYSMISDRFCDLDERWILLGDSAFFVDPLFSSGVAFAMLEASAVALLVKSTLIDPPAPQLLSDLWHDYDRSLQAVARSFALAIDQWYHAIAEANPDSVYWQRRTRDKDFDFRDRTFQDLVDTDFAITPDLAQVLDSYARAEAGSPLGDVAGDLAGRLPSPDAQLTLAPHTVLRDSLSLQVGASKGTYRPWEDPVHSPEVARFWHDPLAHGDAIPSPHAGPAPCHLFVSTSAPERRVKVPFGPGASSPAPGLRDGLARGLAYGAIDHPGERRIVNALLREGLVVAG